jgi:hypothetical protein
LLRQSPSSEKILATAEPNPRNQVAGKKSAWKMNDIQGWKKNNNIKQM